MIIHRFTIEQAQKFISAVGGDPTKSRVLGGVYLTTQQLRTQTESVGGLKDWPMTTDDPHVNFAIDCVVQDDLEELTYDEKAYTADADEFKKSSCGRKYLKNFKKQFA